MATSLLDRALAFKVPEAVDSNRGCDLVAFRDPDLPLFGSSDQQQQTLQAIGYVMTIGAGGGFGHFLSSRRSKGTG